MPKDTTDRISARVDELARTYRLWLVIPLLIAVALAFWNLNTALGFVGFMLFVWIFAGAIGAIMWLTLKLLPQTLSDERRAEIQSSIGVTLFLGGSALIGMVLRGENVVAEVIARHVPEGFHIAFIDPTFAVLCCGVIWVYTVYRLRT